MAKKDEVIFLFDVDGTLTEPRKVITPDMLAFMNDLKTKVTVGLVGGSDFSKICEQMEGEDTIKNYEYVFAENGLVAYKAGELIGKENLVHFMGEEKVQKFINHSLQLMSTISLPAKRGTFVEFRNGMLNICPVGRSCTREERNQFSELDQKEHIRQKMVENFKKNFSEDEWAFVIGGQISIDVFPTGWDKRYCLRYVENQFKTIVFIGDKTYKGGNDHEIFDDSRTIGYTTDGPETTKKLVAEALAKV
ncbi:phosphomannomutase 2-like [Amphiura filiformis]|uniref:phosphomannomutase 2-like n=1 Tax=Amphiura filiformis TaxID=82378 RepID=UPI003B22050E